MPDCDDQLGALFAANAVFEGLPDPTPLELTFHDTLDTWLEKGAFTGVAAVATAAAGALAGGLPAALGLVAAIAAEGEWMTAEFKPVVDAANAWIHARQAYDAAEAAMKEAQAAYDACLSGGVTVP